MNSDQGLKKLHPEGGKSEFISSMEWNEHSLGDMNKWPQSFRTALNIVLHNSLPAFLLWEDEAYTFPNKKFVQEYLPETSHKKITGLIPQTAIPDFWNRFKLEAEALYENGQPFEKTIHYDRTSHSDPAYYNLISLNATPVHLEDGSVGGMIVVCMDVMPNYAMANELKDRIKEQETLQSISQLRETFTTVDDYLSRLTEMIPPAMQFPRIAEAAVEYGDEVYESENYGDCKNSVFSIEKKTSAGDKLVIHLGYTQETSQATKSSVFVQKEKKLVENIANQAVITIDSFRANKIVEQSQKERNLLHNRISEGYLKLDADFRISEINQAGSELLHMHVDEMVGKQLLNVLPEAKSLSLLRAYKNAISKQEAETLELYLESLNSRFKLTIYPDDNGTSIFFSDITQNLQEQKEYDQLSQLVDEVQSGIVRTDSQNNITWVNKTFTTLTGFTPEESMGKTLTHLLPGPDTDIETIQRISDKTAREESVSEQILYYTKEGDEIWFKENRTPIKDEGGSLIEYLVILDDISQQRGLDKLLGQVQNMAKIGGWDYEMDGNKWIRGTDRPEYLDGKFVRIFDNINDIQKRKELEKQFDQSRNLLESLVDQIEAGIWVIDNSGNIILMNDECKKLFNISSIDETKSRSVDKILDPDSVHHIKECIDQVHKTNKPKTLIENKTVESEERTYLINIFPLKNIPGLNDTVGAVYTNVTSYKQKKAKLSVTEEKLQEVIHHSTNLFYSHTPDHELTYLSPQSKNFLGIEPDETPINWTELITDHPVNEKALQITKKALETGQPQPPYELQLRKTSGEIIWAEAHESPIVKDGKTVAIAGSLTDITQRKIAEEKLKDSLHEKETLLAEIHHRVKNNLAIVSGLMQLQAFNTDNKEFAKLLNVSVSRMRSIASIHEQLYQSDSFSTIDLAESLKNLINQVINTMQIPTQIEQELDLQSVILSMEQALPCSLIVNEVVTNILKHAFVESEVGVISVHLSEHKNRITLEISDDGVGLPEDFDIEKSDSLGMELINTLSEQLEADISYQSDDSGTRFKMSFDNDET